jgi:hypothetical protein
VAGQRAESSQLKIKHTKNVEQAGLFINGHLLALSCIKEKTHKQRKK